MAKRGWLGQRVRLGGPDAPFRTIVGDVSHDELSAPPPMQMYLPQAQMTDAFLTLVVRTPVDPAGLAPAIRREVRAVAPVVPVYGVAALDDLVAESIAERRFLLWLLGSLAGVALLLAIVGVYGVVAWWVAQRRPEMAIRIALGASPGRIARLVLRQGAGMIAAGIVAGIAAALALTGYLESRLFGVEPGDPLTFVAIVMLVLTAATLANLLPATRASRVDPLQLLRSE